MPGDATPPYRVLAMWRVRRLLPGDLDRARALADAVLAGLDDEAAP